VHMLFDGRPDRPWKFGEQKRNQLIFIGRNLDRVELNAGFQACLATRMLAR
jgi:G3E family GTPase